MKTVFTNSQLAHVWAQQTQSYGNTGGSRPSMYFRDDRIYSYGDHYLMARIHNVKGTKLCLLNSDSYSNTTIQHRYCVTDAVRGLMNVVVVPNPETIDSKENIAYVMSELESRYTYAEKKMKVDDNYGLTYPIESINDKFKETNEYLKLIGHKAVKLDTKRVKAIEAHLQARYKRYKELNTPEALAKKAVEKAKREANKDIIEAKKQEKLIAKFRAGESVQLKNMPYELLRIQGDEVVTSRGARVPLIEAKHIISYFKNIEIENSTFTSFKIGHFNIESLTTIVNCDFKDDAVLKIGCHNILLSEALNVVG